MVGAGQDDIKKGLKIDFVGEEGIDAGGLRKEWFLLLIREVFDEAYGRSDRKGFLNLTVSRLVCV